MKIKEIGEEYVIFDNGTKMQSIHESDCCEWHWAAFDTLETYNINPKTGQTISILDLDFPEKIQDNIQLIEGEGFNLIASDGSKYFIPCYASNNGYYSDNLQLIITKNKGMKVKIDLQEYQQDYDIAMGYTL